MKYRREIDGLRALAVIPVVLFHAGFETFSGGFVGVDLFFVISGYLITTIILSELELGNFSIVNFYERRARRILPALFLVMIVCIFLAWFILMPNDMKEFSRSLVAVSVFASNILFMSESGYFDTAVELKPLLHTWSLAVEEQYYIFFPLLLMLFWRFGRRWILILLFSVFLVSLALAQWASFAMPSAAFYSLPTRGWELLIGSFAAFYLSKNNRTELSAGLNEIGAGLGLLLILYSILFYSKATPFPGLYALVPTTGAVLVILFANQKTIVGKFVGNKVFVSIGLVSYSAYLWHQPLFAFARHRSLTKPSDFVFLALSVGAFFLAYFSWKYVEGPFRNRERFTRKLIFIISISGSILFICFGAAGYIKNGFKSRLPSIPHQSELNLPRIDNGWCFYSIDSMPGLAYGNEGLNCFLGDLSSTSKGLLFGDSFAGQYEPLWDIVGRSTKIKIHSVTTNWCYPSITNEFPGPQNSRSFQQCLFNRKYLKENISKYDLVVFAGSWGAILSESKLHGVLDIIKYASSNVRLVVVMAAPKTFDTNPLSEYKRSIWKKYDFNIADIGTIKDKSTFDANNILKFYSEKFDNVIYVDRDSLFSLNGAPSNVTNEGIPFSLDGWHISIYGSKVAAKSFLASDVFEKFNSLYK